MKPRWPISLLLTLLCLACSKPLNTPEEVFATARSALADKRWERLFDVLPLETQAAFAEQLSAFEQQVRIAGEKIVAEQNVSLEQAIEQVLVAQVGLTVARWQALPLRERFAAFFEPSGGQVELLRIGIDIERLANSTIDSVTIAGSTAEMTVRDAEQRPTRLTFTLSDRLWHLDLGYE